MALTPSDFDFVRAFVSGRAGIVLESGKEYLVESRLKPLATKLGFASIADLVAALRRTQDRNYERQLIEAMTTNETTFFRDIAPFDALRDHVLPPLIAARRSSRQLNIWCAASSTGQEPYSVAMLLAELLAAGAADHSEPALVDTLLRRFVGSPLAQGVAIGPVLVSGPAAAPRRGRRDRRS